MSLARGCIFAPIFVLLPARVTITFSKYKTYIWYGILLALLLFFLKWLELHVAIFDYAMELYIGAIAALFMGLGIWAALKLAKPRPQTIIVEKEVFRDRPAVFAANEKELEKLELSRRELEVLELMARGLSNQEIAEQLFVSLNTIKTHSSNLFSKLDVKRRTQAIEKAKRLNIIP